MDTILLEYRPGAFAALEAALLTGLESGAHVRLDLDSLESLDIEGIRGLIALLRRARAIGGEVSLRVSRPEIRRTLAVTALDRLFQIVEAEAA